MTTLSVGDEDAYIEQTRFRRVNTGASWVVLVEALVQACATSRTSRAAAIAPGKG